MKKILSVLLIMSICLAAGCTAVPFANEGTPLLPVETEAPAIPIELSIEEPAEAAVEEPLPAPLPVVHDFGEPEAIVVHADELQALLLYPVCEYEGVNAAISGWAKQLMDSVEKEVAEMQVEDPAAECELNVHYNAYLTGAGYVGIEELGTCMSSHMAHPRDIVQTFNVDVNTGALLENAALFPQDAVADILNMLREKLSAVVDDPSEIGEMDGTWLDYPVLKPDGVVFHLPRGYLASVYGLQSVPFTYEELNGLLDLQAAEATPVPTVVQQADIIEVPEVVEVPEAPLEVADFYTEINPSAPLVALTFDDGPSVTTPKILSLLSQYGGRATFCVIGNRVESKADTIASIVAQGSEVASHTWDHKNLKKLGASEIRSEITHAENAIVAAGAPKPRWLRPPYGSVDDEVKSIAAELGYALVNWSIDTEDWKTRNAQTTYERIMAQVEDGSIILCHDLHAETGDAMELVIPALAEKGYRMVTVTELMQAKGVTITPGKLYRHPEN